MPVVRVSSEVNPDPQGGLVRDVTVVYQFRPGQEPWRLTYRAPSPVAVEVPFVLRDVPVPAAK